MKIHRKLVLLVGMGMLLIMAITVVSLQYITATFSRTVKQTGRIAVESGQIWEIERNINEISHAIQNFVITGEETYLEVYKKAHSNAEKTLGTVSGDESGQNENPILGSLQEDLERMKKKAEVLFSLKNSSRAQKMQAAKLLSDLHSLQNWIGRGIAKYRAANAGEMDGVLRQLRKNRVAINLVFFAILITSLGSLFGFLAYTYRKISLPLNDLWEGTEEISQGNLDYQVQVQGEGDIPQLGARFNEMAQKLKFSYSNLEQKLYERTHELASLDAVALTLSHTTTLQDTLDKSLLKVLDGLSGIEPKGGVFVCEPDGQTLRLMAQKGLTPEFINRETTIRMGECLCGTAAQTGELLFTEHACEDKRHLAGPGEEKHSHIIIPMKSRGIVLGVIFLYPQKNFKLKRSDIQMLDAVGAQLGMAIENFRFYAEVKESSEKYWDLFENSTDILFTIDSSGKLTAVNKAAEAFSGYSKVELFGKSVFSFLTPEGVKAVKRMVTAGLNGRQWTEVEVTRRSGNTAFIEVSVRQLLRNEQSAGYHVSARDVTEQKRLRELLVQAERLGAIGQLGIAVRHEINNPLTTVIGNIELLIERYGNRDRELTVRLETVLSNALRIAEIVKKLQEIKKDKVVEYLRGVKMTDLKQN